MSDSRGRRDGISFPHNYPRPLRQSWSDQVPNFFPADHSHQPGWAEDYVWNRPQGSRWDIGPQNMMGPRAGWGRQNFHGPRNQFNEPPQQFEQYQQQFPSNPFPRQSSSPYGERSLINITTNSLGDEASTNSRSVREGNWLPPHRSKSSVPGKVEYQTLSSQLKGFSFKADRSHSKDSNTAKAGNTSKTPSAISTSKTIEKQSLSAQKPSSFMPPNDDLRNMVKESLKAMSRAGTSSARSTSSAAEPPTDSPRRVRESRIPSGDQSQLRRSSGDNVIRRSSGEYHGSPSSSTPRTPTNSRRRVQSQSSTTSNEGNSNSVIDGLGFIQRTPGDFAPSPSHLQSEEEPVTISREQLSRYIRSMDNQQRRQLVEQPRDSISKSLLDHLVQENQTDRARQLSSLRFRVSSTDLDPSSRNETHVMLSDELVEQIKELLAQQDAEDASNALPKTRNDDDEIEIIEPPPRTPPICIELDCDEPPQSPPSTVEKNTDITDEATEIQPSSLDSLLAEINASLTDGTSIETAEALRQPALNVGASSRPCSPLPTQLVSAPLVEESHQTNLPQETLAGASPLINDLTPCEAQSSSIHSTTSMETCPSRSQEDSRPSANEASVRNSIPLRTDLVDSPPEENRLSSEPAPDNDPGPSAPTSDGNKESGLLIESVKSLALVEQPEKQAETAEGEMALEMRQPLETVSTSSRLIELHREEQADVARLASIDQMIIDLQNERKMITERLLVRKQHQFDIICSSFPNSSLPQFIGSTDAAEASTSKKTKASNNAEAASLSSKSSRLLDLVLQLEQNGVQVALGKSLEKPAESSSKKRKRSKTQTNDKAAGGEESQVKGKSSTPSSSRNNKTAAPAASTPPPDAVGAAKAKKRKSSSLKVWDVSTSATTKSKSSKSQKQSSSTSSKTTETNSEDATQKESGSKSKKSTPSSNPATESNTESTVSISIQSISTAPEPLRSPPPPSSPKAPQLKGAPQEPLRSPSSSKAATQEPATKSNQQKPAEPKKSRTAESQPAKRTEASESLPTSTQAKVPRYTGPEDLTNVDHLELTLTASDTSSSQGSSSGSSRALESHTTAVKTMCVNGPCLFTASDDGTVHVYDLVTYLLTMRILGHQDPVTFLYAVSLKKTAQQLKECSSPAEYLNSLNLITGSRDGCVRQFSLETGNVLHETDCRTPVTCAVANKRSLKLYIGTKSGSVFSFDPQRNDLRPVRFRAAGELLCMKMVNLKSRKALALAATKCDIVIYDCATEERLLSLSTGAPLNSIHSMSTSGNLLFCCDTKKSLFTFDLASDKNLLRVDYLPSIAVDCYYHNKFLFLACQDGEVRVFDTHRKPGNPMGLRGPHPKTLSCMKFSDSKIVCGTLAGEVFLRAIPRFASGK